MLEQAKEVFVTYYCRVAILQAETLVPVLKRGYFLQVCSKFVSNNYSITMFVTELGVVNPQHSMY